MSVVDSTLIVKIFFGISLIVFLITIYIILPAFLYDKRTFYRPELIKAMWNRFYTASLDRAKINWARIKKKTNLIQKTTIISPSVLKSVKRKSKIGLYHH